MKRIHETPMLVTPDNPNNKEVSAHLGDTSSEEFLEEPVIAIDIKPGRRAVVGAGRVLGVGAVGGSGGGGLPLL